MNNIKKVLILLFLVVMISGCSVKYDLKINKDLSVNEKVVASEKTDRMKSRTNLDTKQSVRFLYNIFKLDSMGDDDYSIGSSNNNTEVTVNNSYDSIEDYEKYYHNNLFEHSIYTSFDGNKVLSFKQIEKIDSKSSNRFVYDDLEITIEVPFEVIKNNADYSKGNKYVWKVNSDSKKLKDIYIEFSPDNLKDSVSFKFGENSFNLSYTIIVIIVVLVFTSIVAIFLYNKNKKNNRM